MTKLIVTLDLDNAREASRGDCPISQGDVAAAWLCRAASIAQLALQGELDDPWPSRLHECVFGTGQKPLVCVRLE